MKLTMQIKNQNNETKGTLIMFDKLYNKNKKLHYVLNQIIYDIYAFLPLLYFTAKLIYIPVSPIIKIIMFIAYFVITGFIFIQIPWQALGWLISITFAVINFKFKWYLIVYIILFLCWLILEVMIPYIKSYGIMERRGGAKNHFPYKLY